MIKRLELENTPHLTSHNKSARYTKQQKGQSQLNVRFKGFFDMYQETDSLSPSRVSVLFYLAIPNASNIVEQLLYNVVHDVADVADK